MNSLTIRKSKDPRHRTSYAMFFYSCVDKLEQPQLIGTYTTPNGSFVEVGRVIDNWCNHNSLPLNTERKELTPIDNTLGYTRD